MDASWLAGPGEGAICTVIGSVIHLQAIRIKATSIQIQQVCLLAGRTREGSVGLFVRGDVGAGVNGEQYEAKKLK